MCWIYSRSGHLSGAPRFLLCGLDAVFHPVAFTLEGGRFGMVKQAVEDGGGDHAVVVENRGPCLEGLVAGKDDGALLIAPADDLEEQVGALFIACLSG